MKAMLVSACRLVMGEVEKPSPKADEVLIKIKAAGVNRADILQRLGRYPSPEDCPPWMGLEVAGVVEDIGENAEKKGRFKIGDDVCALLGGGGYAQFVCVPEIMTMPMPKGLSYVQAAAIPEAYATSYLNLFIEGHLKSGQTLFVPAGASGLASAAIPLAKVFGARVITSVLSEDIAESIAPLGADIVVNSKTDDIAEVLKQQEKNGTPVNAAMDCLSGDDLGRCMPYMARGGYWIVISTLAGVETKIALRPLLTKGLHLVGSMLRNKTPEQKAEILNALVENVFPEIESGALKINVCATFPLEQAEKAHTMLENGKNTGKVVLTVC